MSFYDCREYKVKEESISNVKDKYLSLLKDSIYLSLSQMFQLMFV